MITGLEKVYTVSAHQIYNAMLLGQPARPHACAKILQRFWFTQTSEGVAQNCFHQIKHAQGRSSLCLDPVAQVFAELRVKDRIALTRARPLTRGLQGQPPYAVHQETAGRACDSGHGPAPSRAVRRLRGTVRDAPSPADR